MSASNRRQFLFGSAALAGGVLVAPGTGALRALRGLVPRPPGAARDAELRERFLSAVVAGRAEEVRALLANDRSLADAADAQGRSAVVLACMGRHDEVLAALLEHQPTVGLIEACMIPDWDRAVALGRADPAALDAFHPVGGTSIYAAARAGLDDAYHLQDLGADPDRNPRGRFGVTPAYGAIECRRPQDALAALIALLSNGAHANAPQREGDSLLHAAARRGDPAIVRYLLRRGADVGARNARGRTPLELAENHEHAAVVELLAHPGRVPRDDSSARYASDASGGKVAWPDLSDVPQEEQSAVTGPSHGNLDKVKAAARGEARRSFSRSTQNELAVEACAHTGNREIMRFHIDRGVPQSVCTSISVGDLQRARALLAKYPAAVHERGPHDFPLMWYASIGGGDVQAAELLLDAGVDVNQASQGDTVLHWAVARHQLDLVACLAEKGADLDAVGYKFDREGQTPLQAARQAEDGDMVTLLSDLGAR